jgi:hypothetical protein
MDEQSQDIHLRNGFGWCALSLLLLPAGLLAIGGGPCAGPNNALGSMILLSVGLACTGAAIYGSSRLVRGLRSATNVLRVAAVLSLIGSVFIVLLGGFYLVMGAVSFQSYMSY